MQRSTLLWLCTALHRLAIPLSALFFATVTTAQTPATAPNAAKTSATAPACNAEAEALQLHNQEKLTFLQQCELKDSAPGKRAPSEKQLAHQQKMKDCNAKAKTDALKGEERKAFMKQCLRADKATANHPATK